MTTNPILVDARNYDTISPQILSEIIGASLIGFDIETEDSQRHEGLNAFMKVDDEGFSHNDKLIFDIPRTTVCGFSIHPEGSPNTYYVNLAHADVENRLPWSKARIFLDAKRANAYWVIHNAPFEKVMMMASLGYDVRQVICSMQFCVSAYGPDDYDEQAFIMAGLGGMKSLIAKIAKTFRGYTGPNMTPAQSEVFSQVVGKASKAKHSYNGFVKDITYGYDLKKAVKSWFGYQMVTFEQVLGDKPHMGKLTGEEVVSYGCDDAFWCLQLYKRVLEWLLQTNPAAVQCYFEQELPMIDVYADAWREGVRINKAAVLERRDFERHHMAEVLRKLKAVVKDLLPFDTEPHAKLMELDAKWYKNYAKYRGQIVTWATTPDEQDDYLQCHQVRGPVSNRWAEELGKPESLGPNFSHYMPVRTLIYDLLREKLIVEKGKVQSDAEARGKLIERLKERPKAVELLLLLAEIAGIEQRMKLYLAPYLLLVDPDTGKLHPILSSMQASRRMGLRFPNTTQLAKRGESTYIRGFYLPDHDDHVIVSIDWQQVELVEIAEFSGDPEFRKCYGQLPYDDLHLIAAADALDMTLDGFKSLARLADEVAEVDGRKLIDKQGQAMTPSKAFKYWRTEIGKGSNFNYWYSGALSTVGDKMGWTPDEMWERTEKYRQRFAVAEKWRVGTILDGQTNGFVQLPDGHRRTRFEATWKWAEIMRNKWGAYNDEGLSKFADLLIRKVQTRANNQLVNSYIQGTCATLAKRSIIRIKKALLDIWECWKHTYNTPNRMARFMFPIHDELLFSVHKDFVVDFIKVAKAIMCHHPDIIKTLPLNATAAVGQTFEPFHAKKAPLGQIELDEAPDIAVVPRDKIGGILSVEEQRAVVQWIFNREQERKAA